MRFTTLILLSVFLLFPIGVRGQSSPSWTESAVDQVTPKRGPRLAGAVLDCAADGTLTLAISRDWLKGAHRTFYETCDAEQKVERRKAHEELRDRLVVWIEKRPEPQELAFFLKKEAERVAKALAAPGDAPSADEGEFLLLSYPAAQIERIQIHPPERKRIALLAWREQLPDVEKRTAASLLKELHGLKLDPAKEHVDLYDRLPVRRQNDAEWAGRQALVEYQYRQPLDFQGTGDLVLRVGGGASKRSAGELMAALFKDQLAGQLAGLLDDTAGARPKPESTAWLDAAANMADREGVAGFRVTRVMPDVAAQRVQVESRFVTRSPAGRWETLWRHAETIDATRPDKQRMDRIAQDPQVKQALELVRSTGLGAAGDEHLQTALRMGAATMQAQQEADGRFFEFRDRNLKRLDGPPLKPAEPGPR